MNENLAIVGSNALVLDSPEDTLTQEASLIEKQASSVAVTNDAEYAAAGDLTKAVKKMQKKVKDYWEPMRVNAKAAYDEVLAHKKEMLDPLEAAEKILKGKMGDYSMEKERKRRAQEEAMRKLAEQEMNRKLEEAARAEAAGDTAGAEFAMVEAEVMEGVSISGSIQAQTPKAAGVSQSKTWEIVSIDSSKVPFPLKEWRSGRSMSKSGHAAHQGVQGNDPDSGRPVPGFGQHQRPSIIEKMRRLAKMAPTMALSKAEQNALCVSYDVLGTHVELDLQFVKRYLVRGNPR